MLGDLAPILAAVVGPLLALALAMMRFMHHDGTKTRSLMYNLIDKSNRENRELIDKSNQETRDLIRENRDLIRENRDLIDKNHSELTGSLGEVRERLSRIEGFLRQPPPADGEAQAA